MEEEEGKGDISWGRGGGGRRDRGEAEERRKWKGGMEEKLRRG